MLKLGNSTINWSSNKQKSVSLSTTEAEYVAACETARQITWVKNLIRELNFFDRFSTTLFIDNLSTIKLIKNPEFHQRTKNIDTRYHYVREKYAEREFLLQHETSEDQQADLLTKPLPRPSFEIQKKMINVINIHTALTSAEH